MSHDANKVVKCCKGMRVGNKDKKFQVITMTNHSGDYNSEDRLAYLYGAVEMPREAILDEQSCEVEHCQKQGFELSIVWTVTN